MTINFMPGYRYIRRYKRNEVEDFYQSNQQNNMKNGIFKLEDSNVKSAVVYGLLWGLLAVLLKVQEAGSIFNLDWKALIDTGVFALIGAGISLLKNLFTTNKGNFLGVVKVIPETK